VHGNPALSTLRAIASTIRQTQDEYWANPNAPPKLLFFSDPDSLTDVTRKVKGIYVTAKSNVWQLLNDSKERPYVPPGIGNPKRRDPNDHRDVYNYQCYKIRKGNLGAGRIILGCNVNGGLAVQFSVAAAADDPNDGTLNFNDWIYMPGAA
jgi:hypothetical protein